ncbi:hypothetical protein [Halalkalicoccus tibetensis]|uniref:DUF8159 domain-containing protein n=1 Tax=Halalkalicoccus tibetensis TaxID=175632 RepID=A0ABD5V2S3_9EURY
MERRKVLLGSGAAIATILAGCTASGEEDTDSPSETELEMQDKVSEGDEEEDSTEEDESESDDKEKEQDEIPGFDRENFEIDSETIHVKRITCENRKLTIDVKVTTNDRDELVEELRALGPAFEDAIRDADADEFFTEVEELHFTLYDEDKNVRFAFFIDVRWLQQFIDDDISNDELVDEMLDEIGDT